jgi:ATP-dependent Clp protease ATP-binding subunit ClpA
MFWDTKEVLGHQGKGNRKRVLEKFTARARRAVVKAQEEARTRQHACVGTEHLLLGLIAKRQDPLVQVLRRLGAGDHGYSRQG